MTNAVQNAIKALESKGFHTVECPTAEAAKKWCLDQINAGESVGSGGSMTLNAMEILPALAENGAVIHSHWNCPPEKVREVVKEAAFADFYLSSANAITENGEIYNVDGRGNRVAAITFGPKKVFIFAGKNKVVKDVPAAIERVEKVAAPPNATRLNRKTPCVKTGECMNCSSPDRVCKIYSLITHCPIGADITVIFIDENLGY